MWKAWLKITKSTFGITFQYAYKFMFVLKFMSSICLKIKKKWIFKKFQIITSVRWIHDFIFHVEDIQRQAFLNFCGHSEISPENQAPLSFLFYLLKYCFYLWIVSQSQNGCFSSSYHSVQQERASVEEYISPRTLLKVSFIDFCLHSIGHSF